MPELRSLKSDDPVSRLPATVPASAKLQKLLEAAVVMLLTVGLIAAIIAILACTLFSAPWPIATAIWLTVWILFTLDFYSAETEKERGRTIARSTKPL